MWNNRFHGRSSAAKKAIDTFGFCTVICSPSLCGFAEGTKGSETFSVHGVVGTVLGGGRGMSFFKGVMNEVEEGDALLEGVLKWATRVVLHGLQVPQSSLELGV